MTSARSGPAVSPGVLFLAALAAAVIPARGDTAELVLQRAWIAGLAHHDLAAAGNQLAPGESVQLCREGKNGFDPRAVRIDWAGHTLGYLPRNENAAAAWAIDRGAMLSARIVELRRRGGSVRRIRIEVYLR